MNDNASISANEAFVNFFATEFFNSNTSLFNGSVVVQGETFNWTTSTPPVLTLTAAAPNLSLLFTDVTLTSPGVPGSATLTVTVTGSFAIVNNVMSITGVTASVTGDSGFIDDLLQQAVNTQIANEYASAISSVPVPAITIFSTGLQFTLDTATTQDGLLNLTACLNVNGWAPPDSAPPMPTVTGTGPAAALSLTCNATQLTIQEDPGVFPVNIPINYEHDGDLGTGYGVRGGASVALPMLQIDSNIGLATTVIDPSVQGGLRAFGHWSWFDLPALNAQVTLATALGSGSAGTKAVISVVGMGDPSYQPPSCPAGLSPVCDAIWNIIASIETPALARTAVGQNFTVATLPTSLPSPYSGVLTFASLEFTNGTVTGVVNVAPASGARA